MNVIPRNTFASKYGVPLLDNMPTIDREAYEAAVRKSETFIVKRFLSRIPPELQTTPVVHIVKVGAAILKRCPVPAIMSSAWARVVNCQPCWADDTTLLCS